MVSYVGHVPGSGDDVVIHASVSASDGDHDALDTVLILVGQLLIIHDSASFIIIDQEWFVNHSDYKHLHNYTFVNG